MYFAPDSNQEKTIIISKGKYTIVEVETKEGITTRRETIEPHHDVYSTCGIEFKLNKNSIDISENASVTISTTKMTKFLCIYKIIIWDTLAPPGDRLGFINHVWPDYRLTKEVLSRDIMRQVLNNRSISIRQYKALKEHDTKTFEAVNDMISNKKVFVWCGYGSANAYHEIQAELKAAEQGTYYDRGRVDELVNFYSK